MEEIPAISILFSLPFLDLREVLETLEFTGVLKPFSVLEALSILGGDILFVFFRLSTWLAGEGVAFFYFFNILDKNPVPLKSNVNISFYSF